MSLINFSEADLTKLRRLVANSERLLLGVDARAQEQPLPAGASIYLARLASGDTMPARSGTTAGSQDCELYKIAASSGAITAHTVNSVAVTREVFNPYGWALYDDTVYFPIIRTTWGRWVMSAPPPRELKVKPDSSIAASASGTCSIWLNGSDSGHNITCYFNWMKGSATLASGVEAVARFYEDEMKWTINNADCS